MRKEMRAREKEGASVAAIGFVLPSAPDPSHSPVSERMERSETSSVHRRTASISQRLRITDQHCGILDSHGHGNLMESISKEDEEIHRMIRDCLDLHKKYLYREDVVPWRVAGPDSSEKKTNQFHFEPVKPSANFGSRTDTIFCGVFDGHGLYGHMVAKRVRDSLLLKLISNWEVNINSGEVLEERPNTIGSLNSDDAAFVPVDEDLRDPKMSQDGK